MSTHNICFSNICCGYSLEVPPWGTSNEYPQHMFLWRNKKFIQKDTPHICSCLFSQEQQIYVTICLFSCKPIPFLKGIYKSSFDRAYHESVSVSLNNSWYHILYIVYCVKIWLGISVESHEFSLKKCTLSPSSIVKKVTRLTEDPGFANSNPSFATLLSWRLILKSFLWSCFSTDSRRAIVSYWRKYAQILLHNLKD